MLGTIFILYFKSSLEIQIFVLRKYWALIKWILDKNISMRMKGKK
jgi:hypothetical protein